MSPADAPSGGRLSSGVTCLASSAPGRLCVHSGTSGTLARGPDHFVPPFSYLKIGVGGWSELMYLRYVEQCMEQSKGHVSASFGFINYSLLEL